MNTRQQKIKIPADVSVIYSKKDKLLIISGPLKIASLKLNLKIFLNNSEKTIKISSKSFLKISNAVKKKIRMLQNTTIAQIKHSLIESSTTMFRKLKIVGVGYRADLRGISNKNLLTLKLGYSHPVYVKTSNELSLSCITKTKINVFGNSYNKVTELASIIRKKKMPDPYKGKGILYEDEYPTLKEGKKV